MNKDTKAGNAKVPDQAKSGTGQEGQIKSRHSQTGQQQGQHGGATQGPGKGKAGDK